VAPALAPAGLGSWEVAGTLLSGMVAKEVVVATLWQVHAPGAEDERAAADAGQSALSGPLRASLAASSGGHPGPAAAALLVFVLLYVPCVATVAAIRHELGGRWAALSVATSLALAWLAATAVFQGGRLVSSWLMPAAGSWVGALPGWGEPCCSRCVTRSPPPTAGRSA
jgi:ferrous iron transport protein B